MEYPPRTLAQRRQPADDSDLLAVPSPPSRRPMTHVPTSPAHAPREVGGAAPGASAPAPGTATPDKLPVLDAIRRGAPTQGFTHDAVAREACVLAVRDF